MNTIKTHIKETYKLAYPVVIGQIGIMAMGVVDSVMVGSVGAVPLAASALGMNLFTIIFIIVNAISLAVTPLTAIASAKKDNDTCSNLYKNSFNINLFTSIILLAVTILLSPLINYMDQPQDVVHQAIIYFQILGFSLIPTSLYLTYKSFIEGLSFTRPGMMAAIYANFVNIIINYFLVYGSFGFPKLGLYGAGIGTFSARIFMAVYLYLFIRKSGHFNSYDTKIKLFHFQRKYVKKILRIGVPGAFQYVFEVSAFAFAVIMVGWLGTTQMAAHQIVLNLASISFMGALGFSSAGTIRVGYYFGLRDNKGIREAGFVAVLLGACIMASSGIIFITLRNFLPSLYIKDSEVISLASSALVVAALFQLSDGTQAVGIGILRGLTDVKIPTLITFFSYWILALPFGYILSFTLHLGLIGVWIGLAVGLTSSAILLMIRFNIKSKSIK